MKTIINVIIQARMGSSRLPGKVLMDIAGKPLLMYLFERLAGAGLLGGTVLATSASPHDDLLEEFCRKTGVICERGPLDDVAGRFLQVLEKHGLKSFVRICGDSPFFDPGIILKGFELFERTGADLLTNTFPRSFPKGQSLEIFDSGSFVRAYGHFNVAEKEHISKYYYAHPEDFNIVNFTSGRNYSDENLCVDTAEDAESAKNIIAAMDRGHCGYGWEQIIELKHLVDRRELLDAR